MISTFQPATRSFRLAIPGDLLSTNVDSLRGEILHAIDAETHATAWEVLELDLRAANMIDSAGLNLVVALIRIASQRSRRVRAIVSNPNLHRTFLFTRLDRHLELIGPSPAP